MVISQVLVTLTLASISLSHQCSNNCYNCIGKNSCIDCYRRPVVKIAGGQGTCSTKTPSPSNRCVIYGSYSCSQCQPGYVPRYVGPSDPRQCSKGIIQNCFNEQIVRGSDHVCHSCLEGYPNSDYTKCLPASQFKNAIPHCKVGGVAFKNLVCQQCQEGYVTDGKVCFKTPPNLVGCLTTDSGRKSCYACDYENGYFNRDPFSCSKNESA